MKLTAVQRDRAAGVLVAQGCGDALGVPYEFKPTLGNADIPEMIGGGLGPYAPGEYSDDTQMAVCIAEELAGGASLADDATLDAIAERFEQWRDGGASDVGIQTGAVLAAAKSRPGPAAARLRDAAAALHRRTGRTAGNGALMRCAPIALAELGDDEGLAHGARAVAELTHADPLAGDSCVLWCVAIDRAVREGRLDGIHDGLALLPAERRPRWEAWLKDAESQPPATFSPNGFTVTALQAALSAISHTPVPEQDPARRRFASQHLEDAVVAAIRIGDDTDTIAAIAGALLGARWGIWAIPARWRVALHGWPGLRTDDLIRLGVLVASRGQSDSQVAAAEPSSSADRLLDRITWHPGEAHVVRGMTPPHA